MPSDIESYRQMWCEEFHEDISGSRQEWAWKTILRRLRVSRLLQLKHLSDQIPSVHMVGLLREGKVLASFT